MAERVKEGSSLALKTLSQQAPRGILRVADNRERIVIMNLFVEGGGRKELLSVVRSVGGCGAGGTAAFGPALCTSTSMTRLPCCGSTLTRPKHLICRTSSRSS